MAEADAAAAAAPFMADATPTELTVEPTLHLDTVLAAEDPTRVHLIVSRKLMFPVTFLVLNRPAAAMGLPPDSDSGCTITPLGADWHRLAGSAPTFGGETAYGIHRCRRGLNPGVVASGSRTRPPSGPPNGPLIRPPHGR
jgi:hypothetical protein